MKNTRECAYPMSEKEKVDLEILEIKAEIEAKKITDDALIEDYFIRRSNINYFAKFANHQVHNTKR
jgi:hypothetical protein